MPERPENVECCITALQSHLTEYLDYAFDTAIMPVIFRQIAAVFMKELRSELATRAALNAALMFVSTTVMMIAFATADEKITNGVASGLLWVVLFFSAMTGLARTFVAEEERGTTLLLQLVAPPMAVYFGKLLFNIALMLALAALGITLFVVVIHDVSVKSPLLFLVGIILGSIATASATTMISAIIAKASSKGALLPVLAFPVLLPLVLVGVEITYQALVGIDMLQARQSLQLMAAYIVVVVSLSSLLFDAVWKD
jgi:heme exporter protein B